MSFVDDAKDRLGELFIIGFEGKELKDDTSAFLSQSSIGGVLLFAHNYQSPEQLARLNIQIQECRKDLPLWISVDQEGGRVQRLKQSFTVLPSAAEVAKTGSPKLAFEIGELIGKELKALGINLDFAPVADILTEPKNPVIGDRAYGTTEEEVSKMVTAIARGLLVSGVQPCVKHFPGHGDTVVDSHVALPRVETSLEALREREFKPFMKAFKSRCSFVMTAHILNPMLDPQYPATLSEKTLKLLRQELRYTKIIVSDDLEMQAITDHFGAEQAPRMALQAGCDLLIYRTERAARKAYTALSHALDEGELAPQVVLTAAERSRSLKREVLLPYVPPVIGEIKSKIGTPENQAVVQKILH